METDRAEPDLPGVRLIRDTTSASQEGRQYVAPPVSGDRVVQKPVSSIEADDPREFQIRQLRRRFNPIEKAEDGGTTLAFQMAPSDPDFPFEMTGGLDCVLHVPATYPAARARPSLNVKNKEMGRGYQINVERGFDRLAESSPQASLLALLNSLDRQLESWLIEPKAEVPVKIIIPAKQRKPIPPQYGRSIESTAATAPKPAPVENKPPPPSYTVEERTEAKTRRVVETRQLEARLGRLPLFFKSSNGIAYTIPLQPRKPMDLPVPLQAVKSVRLTVPLLYPLESCKIEIVGVSREAAIHTEKGFEQKVRERPERNLMGHINSLAQDMHILATIETVKVQEEEEEEKSVGVVADATGWRAGEESDDVLPMTQPKSEGNKKTESSPHHEEGEEEGGGGGEKRRIKIIPRPPEWGGSHEPEEEEEGDERDESDSSSSNMLSEDDQNADPNDSTPTTINNNNSNNYTTIAPRPRTPPERGILLSFPSLQLEGIEILEVSNLSIMVKCERCKDLKEVSKLRNGDRRVESCGKCGRDLGVGKIFFLSHLFLPLPGEIEDNNKNEKRKEKKEMGGEGTGLRRHRGFTLFQC